MAAILPLGTLQNRHQMSALRKNLEVVWRNNRPARYLPKSLIGGTGWGVWDDKEKRFLKDQEVSALSAEQLSATLVN